MTSTPTTTAVTRYGNERRAPERRPSRLPPAQTDMSIDDALEIAQVDRAEFALLATTTFKHARSLEELATLIATTKRRGLDGLLKHVYFEQFGGSQSEPSLHVGIDGLRAIAAHTGRYAGSQEPRYSGQWRMPIDDRGGVQVVPEKAVVVVWAIVQGRSCAFEGSAFMEESYPGPGPRGRMWRQRPRGMLGIAAERQALRRAFPAETAGLVDADAPPSEFVDVEPVASRTLEQNKAAASHYVKIFGDDDAAGATHHVDTTTGEVLDPGDMGEGGWGEAAVEPESAVEPEPAPQPAGKKNKQQPDVTMRSALGQRFAELVEEAARLEVPFDDLKLEFPAPYEQTVRHGEKLSERIEQKKARLANPDQVEQPVTLPLA
jgi:phage recombination protein Bet